MALSDIYQKASLVQIPSGYKSGTLYSVVPNTSSGDFTVTGDPQGEATRVNKDGLIESVAADVPRLNYDPTNPQDPHLLLEPTRSNLIVRSEEFNLWGDTGVTVTENATTAPTGAQTADLLTSTANNWRRSINYAISNGTAYSFSCFVKKHTTTNNIRFELFKGTNASYLDFEFTTKTITASDASLSNLKVENYTNDWYRVSCKFTANGTNFTVYAYPSQGYSTAGSAYFWGAQLEAGSYATSLIPTAGSAVTRTVDTCVDAGNNTIISSLDGSVFVDLTTINDANLKQINLFDGGNNRITIQVQFTTLSIGIVSNVGGTIQTLYDWDVNINTNDRHKIAIRYEENNSKLYYNGLSQTPTTFTGSWFNDGVLDNFSFDKSGAFTFYGKIHQAMIFNEALTNSELQTLTT